MANKSKHTVLVVENQISLQHMISAALKLKGLSVLCSSNGLDALRLLSLHKVDLILTDWNMPVMNGEEMIKALDSHHTNESAPIVVLSCNQRPENLNSRRT